MLLSPDDPAFHSITPSPVMLRIGIPLCLKSLAPGHENRLCSALMMDPLTGSVPEPWANPGKVCRPFPEGRLKVWHAVAHSTRTEGVHKWGRDA